MVGAYCESHISVISQVSLYFYLKIVGGVEIEGNWKSMEVQMYIASWRCWPQCILVILSNDFSRNLHGMEIEVWNNVKAENKCLSTEKLGFENSFCHEQFSNSMLNGNTILSFQFQKIFCLSHIKVRSSRCVFFQSISWNQTLKHLSQNQSLTFYSH